MRSQHADRFNHDEDALGYDADVTRESHPIRAGYADVLDWVASKVAPNSRVLDLGVGTGNLSQRLPATRQLVGVDVSIEMMIIAEQKLSERESVEFVEADLLGYFDEPRGPYDAVASTYAVHHLTEDEKSLLFAQISQSLCDGGVMAFGDLMFADGAAGDSFLDACPDATLVSDITDEFFWDISHAHRQLQRLGFRVETRQFSALSWGLVAVRSPA